MELHTLALRDAALLSLWFPPPLGSLKGNFDVALQGTFSVVAAVISDVLGNIIMAATHKLHSSYALIGEAFAALLTTRMAASSGCSNFILEGDALLVVLTIRTPSFCFLVVCKLFV